MRLTFLSRFMLFCTLATLAACGDDAAPADAAVDASSDAVVDAVVDAAPDTAPCTTMCGTECVDLDTDSSHCGACDAACLVADHTTTTCELGSCASVCETGFEDCDGDASNGCETDLSSPSSCGTCDVTCDATPNASATCIDGACGTTCDASYDDCDADASNGCETDLNALTSCGSCGSVCAGANAAAVCTDGVCSLACDEGYADCDGNLANGCEVDLTHPSSCGACGNVCGGAPNAMGICTAGTCALLCTDGYGNCDGDAATGCEASFGLQGNCGACGVVCPGATNATGVCSDSSCSTTCDSGFDNCTGAPGCETNLRTTAAHCGGCGFACPAGPNSTAVCAAGGCGIDCDPDFGACTGGGGAAGCTTDLTADMSNCGACGADCSPGATAMFSMCTDSICEHQCLPERGDCDGNPGNRCETDLTSSETHCGACGNACGGAEACDFGACVPRAIVFVTSTTVVPNTLGSLIAADAICQGRATAAGLGGSYRAWLSTSTQSPASRFLRSVMGYARTDGVKVADTWSDLTDGAMDAPINRDEFGVLVPDSSGGVATCDYSQVITNTRTNGTTQGGFTCGNLTGGGGGMAGETRVATGRWTAGCGGTAMCTSPKRLYCFEQR